jgi:tripartite-type tricarboxylate transporter receptor subunit TctC
VRALASYSAKRSATMPDVPTLKELGYDVEFYLWVGLFAPKGTPAGIVQKLRADSKVAANTDAFKEAIKNIGDEHAYLDGPDFQAFWDADAKRVEDAVRTIGRIQT